jgi:SAM-dependent methyltransferase
MDKCRKANQKMWDQFVGVNARSELYELSQFKKGKNKLNSLERTEVGSVRGKSLLHLQCHFGMDTLSWAMLGARVTGVDFSKQGIDLARQLSTELKIPGRFIQSDVYDLPQHLNEEFDIVFASCGVICWLSDLNSWSQIVHRFLKPGGFFYIAEFHPFAQVFENEPPVSDLQVHYSYFKKGVMKFPVDGSYASDEKIEPLLDYEWMHPMADVINSLLKTGLQIEFLHEHSYTCFRAFPFLKRSRDGYWRLPKGMPEVPLTFSLKARKLA